MLGHLQYNFDVCVGVGMGDMEYLQSPLLASDDSPMTDLIPHYQTMLAQVNICIDIPKTFISGSFFVL